MFVHEFAFFVFVFYFPHPFSASGGSEGSLSSWRRLGWLVTSPQRSWNELALFSSWEEEKKHHSWCSEAHVDATALCDGCSQVSRLPQSLLNNEKGQVLRWTIAPSYLQGSCCFPPERTVHPDVWFNSCFSTLATHWLGYSGS